jgi:F0F1-type ATP synthase membrane subunit c/vacuolar-type H+-ATPase subunit K
MCANRRARFRATSAMNHVQSSDAVVSPLGRDMRPSTVITAVILAAVAIFGPAFVIFRLPLIPNWPYVGLICLVASIVVGGVYTALARRHLKRPTLINPNCLFRAFPIWLSVFTLGWSLVRLMTEKYPSLAFSEGVVVEKYRSKNHGYLSVRVEVAGRGILVVEGISPASWDAVSAGSRVSKHCGTSDIAVDGR